MVGYLQRYPIDSLVRPEPCASCRGFGVYWPRVAVSEDSDVLGPEETCEDCHGSGEEAQG